MRFAVLDVVELRSCCCPLRVKISLAGYLEEHVAVVCVCRSDCESVTEMEEFEGRFNVASRLPQYLFGLLLLFWFQLVILVVEITQFSSVGKEDIFGISNAYFITAMFTGAVVLARYIFVSAIFLGCSWSFYSRLSDFRGVRTDTI